MIEVRYSMVHACVLSAQRLTANLQAEMVRGLRTQDAFRAGLTGLAGCWTAHNQPVTDVEFLAFQELAILSSPFTRLEVCVKFLKR
jgi:hypothetical protein